jgi:dolichol-phosphate mannosyltransferase
MQLRRNVGALLGLTDSIPELRAVRTIHRMGSSRDSWDQAATGDAVAMMADESTTARRGALLEHAAEGYDAVFGSRFVPGGGTIVIHFEIVLNRLFNWFIRILFGWKLNDTTNAFKAYRTTTLKGGRSGSRQPHRGAAAENHRARLFWTVIPSTGAAVARNGEAEDQGDGRATMFIVLYVWLEKSSAAAT